MAPRSRILLETNRHTQGLDGGAITNYRLGYSSCGQLRHFYRTSRERLKVCATFGSGRRRRRTFPVIRLLYVYIGTCAVLFLGSEME